MTRVDISEVRIDAAGRLCVTPQTTEFTHIYRSSMEVHWDSEGGFLHSPSPREWSYLQWFEQIVAAVKAEYGCSLSITSFTRWESVDPGLKEAILTLSGSSQA